MPDPGNSARSGAREAIEVAFARFEGSVTAELKNVAHDVRNLVSALAAYATTRDLQAAEEKIDQAEKRIDKLEKNQAWVVRTVIGAVIAGLMGLLGLAAKGVHP